MFIISNYAIGQTKSDSLKKDSILHKNLNEIIVTAPRTNTPLKEVPAAISIVTNEQLNTMSKSIAVDEALRLVPGVKVDNGTGGSRTHVYIRGQGILSERGFRGIQVLIDGIPVNDPGGYAPDLYDVDWKTVKNVEVVKGLAASMYGGSANGGVINITTNDGGVKPIKGTLYTSIGSYGFWKSLAQLDGTKDNVNYRVSYSHTQGDGYRIHQAFLGDNFSEKLNWTPSSKVKITQILTYTKYFNQNSEGMNLPRIETFGPRAANTDAIPYNEFQKTERLTGATIGKFNISKNEDVQVKGFFRMNNYKETSNGGDDNRPYINPGVSVQYNLNSGKEKLINHLSFGADFQSLTMAQHTLGVTSDPNRVDSHFSEECYDNNTILRNQKIQQRGAGAFFIDKLDINKKLYATLNVRYDYIYNQLIDNLTKGDSSLSGSREFQAPTYRFGLAYDVAKSVNIYANYGTGFLAPTNDELSNNPVQWGGFNKTIKPSTSQGEELGFRGDIGKRFYYDVTGFLINSKNEFYRFREAWMGNTSSCYGNIGKSSRYGLETFFSYSPTKFVKVDATYTYSHFQYISPDSVKNHWIPQSPEHILAAEVSFKFLKHFTLTLNIEYQSKWCIQVDDSLYNHYTILATSYQPQSVRSSWVDGFNTYNAEITYNWKIGSVNGDISLYFKNLFDEQYYGFTEPNNAPDYNSYQPVPGREIFGSLRVIF